MGVITPRNGRASGLFFYFCVGFPCFVIPPRYGGFTASPHPKLSPSFPQHSHTQTLKGPADGT